MPPDRIIAARGPFTDDEIRVLYGVLQEIEARRPDATFLLAVEDKEPGEDARKVLDRIDGLAGPVRPGYERTITREESDS